MSARLSPDSTDPELGHPVAYRVQSGRERFVAPFGILSRSQDEVSNRKCHKSSDRQRFDDWGTGGGRRHSCAKEQDAIESAGGWAEGYNCSDTVQTTARAIEPAVQKLGMNHPAIGRGSAEGLRKEKADLRVASADIRCDAQQSNTPFSDRCESKRVGDGANETRKHGHGGQLSGQLRGNCSDRVLHCLPAMLDPPPWNRRPSAVCFETAISPLDDVAPPIPRPGSFGRGMQTCVRAVSAPDLGAGGEPRASAGPLLWQTALRNSRSDPLPASPSGATVRDCASSGDFPPMTQVPIIIYDDKEGGGREETGVSADLPPLDSGRRIRGARWDAAVAVLGRVWEVLKKVLMIVVVQGGQIAWQLLWIAGERFLESQVVGATGMIVLKIAIVVGKVVWTVASIWLWMMLLGTRGAILYYWCLYQIALYLWNHAARIARFVNSKWPGVLKRLKDTWWRLIHRHPQGAPETV